MTKVQACYGIAALAVGPHLPELLRTAGRQFRDRLICSTLAVLATLLARRNRNKSRVGKLLASEGWKLTCPLLLVAYAMAVTIKRRDLSFLVDSLPWLVAYGAIPTFADAVDELMAGNGGDVDWLAHFAILLGLARGQDAAAAMILVMLTGGEALERFAVKKAGRSVERLLAMTPKIAHRVSNGMDGATQAFEDVQLAEIALGEHFVVMPSEMVPVNAIVVDAPISIDDSMLTGEAALSQKRPGELVYSGSINRSSQPVLFEVAALSASSTLQLVASQLQLSSDSQTALERTCIHRAIAFTPLTFAVASAAFLRNRLDWDALLSVFMSATPCPLTIACPVAFLAAISTAARSGITVKSRAALEQASRATVLVLDKTGTLTNGRPSVLSLNIATDSTCLLATSIVLQMAAALESRSLHPLAKAIVAHVEHLQRAHTSEPIARMEVKQFSEFAGRGVHGVVCIERISFELHLGEVQYVGDAIERDVVEMHASFDGGVKGRMAVYIAVNKKLWGCIVLDDAMRAEARGVIDSVLNRGSLLTHRLTYARALTLC